MAEALLQIEGLTKRFGGVTASDAITLDVAQGELHAVIGPNGAGKTTLIGELSGEIRPDAGRIRFDGRDITTLPIHRRSALGLARTFQITSLFDDFTALDNIALAVQAHSGHSFRFWRDAHGEPALREPARAALARVGLAERAEVLVSRLSHGEHRALEIAMALATRPRMLLLDEPMAGMGPEESARMVKLLRELKAEVTILLIEHDMEAVFALADRITVLVYGRVIATGAPEAIRANAEVRQAFPNLTAGENLVATAANRGETADPWTLDKVCALFPRLAERIGSMGNLLSGGEQQMLAIGRALMTNPRLLILDEATEGLAPLVRSEIYRSIERLKAEGMSILVIDKDLKALTRFAEVHYVLEKGRVVWSGSSADLAASRDVQQRYLGV